MSQQANNDPINNYLDVSALTAFGLQSYGPSEVTSLRKAGKIDEAYQKAKENLAKEPGNVWAKREMSWVLYNYLKANAARSFDAFIGYLKELDELKLPGDEVMLFDLVSWQIGKMIFSLLREANPDIMKIKTIFEYAKDCHYTKPSESYSFLFKAFHKAFMGGPDYISFAEWWDFTNFREEDYKKEKLQNGKDVISIAEQAIIAYIKHLLPEQTFQGATIFKKDKALSFMPFLDWVIETHPELQYPPYFKAKLLLAAGDQENMLSALLPFAKRKRNEFWVWDVLSEAFPSDESKRIACLCRALLCRTSDDFLINIRQKLAKWLIINEKFSEAKTEIQAVVNARNSNGWKLPQEVVEWISQNWFEQTQANLSNVAFYWKYLSISDEILFSDMPEQLIVVDFVNKDKKIANFITFDKKRGFFRYESFLRTIQPGDVLAIRLTQPISVNNISKVYTARVTGDIPGQLSSVLKSVTGILRKPQGKSFGFVGEVYVHPSLINSMHLKDGQSISVISVSSFNEEKKEWGWKALKILKS